MGERVRVGVARGVGVTRLPMHMVDAAVTLVHLERFCRALGQRVGVSADPVQTRSYADLVQKLDASELELAWLPPVVALHATRVGLAVPLLAPIRSGSPSFYTALFARASSDIRSEADLAGVRVAWVDRESAAGYTVVRAALRAEGHDLARLFASESFEGSHQAVVQAVVDGTADVGATYLHRDANGAVVGAGWGDAAVRPVFEHGPIPADVLAASAELEPALAERMAEALLEPPVSELRAAACALFEAEGFVRVDAGHLAPLEALSQHFDDPGDHR